MAPLRSFTSLRRYVGSGEDWRQAVWNRWLVSYLSPRPDEHESDSRSQKTPNPDLSAREVKEPPLKQAAEDTSRQVEPPQVELPPAERPPADPNPSDPVLSDPTLSEPAPRAAVEHRQLAARARLDALGQQMCVVEDVLDSLAQRLHARELSERRTNQRMMELIERVVDAAERQSEALERSIATLERVERRLTRVDRWVRPAGMESIPPAAPVSSFASGFTEGGLHHEGPASQRAPSMSGSLGDMSVATLLSVLELERRTGRLSIDGENNHVRFELLDGAVVSGAAREHPEDPLEVLRTALSWRDGNFSFCHGPVVAGDYPPRSVGALLLEATHQNDEAVRISS